MLDDLGVLPAISWLCRELQGSFRSLAVELTSDVREADIPEHLKAPVFRVLQEALNNVAKHAHATSVRVHLAKDHGRLLISVQDDGCGFDRALKDVKGSGLGLASMQERAEMFGGSLSIQATPGKGTKIEACWPLPKRKPKTKRPPTLSG